MLLIILWLYFSEIHLFYLKDKDNHSEGLKNIYLNLNTLQWIDCLEI